MAFSSLDRGNVNGTGTSVVVPSFTPNANRLLVCWAVCHEGTISGITGHGTWSQRANISPWGGNNISLELWACFSGGSPSASAVTVSKTGSADSMAAGVIEIDGAKIDGTIAQAFGVSGSASQYDTSGTSISATLASFAAATNAVFAVTATDAYTTNENWTAEAGWQGIIHEQAGVAALTGAIAWDDAEDNNPTFTTVHTYCDRAILAIEVIEATGASGAIAANVGIDIGLSATAVEPVSGSITPANGRVAFVAAHDPHTYWELNSTNLGTNYGTDTGANNSNVAAGDISTQESYDGMNNQNDPPTNILLDTQIVTDAACLAYIPAGLTHDEVYGLFHNGGNTNAQGAMLRVTATGVEVALCHNVNNSNQDFLIEEIPDADLPGWFTLGFQFSSEGGAQGDCGLWINGEKVRNATRTYQLGYGSGDPDFGNSGADEPVATSVRDPASYSGGNWGAAGAITGSGILIANFTADNPTGTNTNPPGNGDSFYTDFHSMHSVAAASSISAAPDVAIGITATLGGTGALLASPSIAFASTVVVSATGELAASPDVAIGINANLQQAAESQQANLSFVFSETFTLGGAGALSATPSIGFGESLVLSGRGALSAAPSLAFSLSAVPVVGSLVANVSIADVFAFGEVTLLGIAPRQSSPDILLALSGQLSGRSSLASSIDIPIGVTATASGNSSVSASPNIDITIAAQITGIGSIASSIDTAFSVNATLGAPAYLQAAPSLLFDATGNIYGKTSLSFSTDLGLTITAMPSGAGVVQTLSDVSPLVLPIHVYSQNYSGLIDASLSLDIAVSASLQQIQNIQAAIPVDFSLTAVPVDNSSTLTAAISIADLFDIAFAGLDGRGELVAAVDLSFELNAGFSLEFDQSIGFGLVASLSGIGGLVASPDIAFGSTAFVVNQAICQWQSPDASFFATSTLSGGSTGLIDGAASVTINTDWGNVILYNDGNGNFFTHN